MSTLRLNHGFTFIEVLIAMLIFTLAAVTAIELVRGSVRATQDTKQITKATWLLQSLMAELEVKLDTVGFERGCEKSVGGSFPPPNDEFSWTATCNEIDFNLSQTAAQLAVQAGQNPDENKEDPILNMILDQANKYMAEAVREIHGEVSWQTGMNTRKISATTHLVDLSLPLNVPSISNQ